MGIDLGLRRISQLLGFLGNPHKSWYSVHVAGTNGKGSVCAYLTSILQSASIRSGRFTSPHFINRWDAITIDGESITEKDFTAVESVVRAADAENNIGATEFELLTAVAFEIFARHKVRIAVVEVGLGGRLDSTNVLEPPKSSLPLTVNGGINDQSAGVLATVITKIGLDHQSFLGDTLGEIASEKAGIIKPGVPSVVDSTNLEEAMSVVQRVAKENNSPLIKATALQNSNTYVIQTQSWGDFDTQLTPLLGNYQKANLACALNALEVVSKWFPVQLKDKRVIEKGIKSTEWPGRLQLVDFQLPQTNKPVRVLLDGAHNPQAADELADFLDGHIRPTANDNAITFVIAFTKGKDYEDIIRRVIKPCDKVVTTEFSSIDGMPWISSYRAEETANMVSKTIKDVYVESVPGGRYSQLDAVAKAYALSSHCNGDTISPIVVFGSLYLVGKIIERHQQIIS